jgi:hypothetical protein
MRELEKWIKQFAANIEERYQALDAVLEAEKKRLADSEKKGR